MSLDSPLAVAADWTGDDVEVLAPGTAVVRLPQTAAIEQAHDPARAAVEVLVQARDMLDQASRDEDIDRLIELKDGAELIREWSAQKKMGLELELSAAEFVRRTERAIGKAIRAGQERGEIRRMGQVVRKANQHGRSADAEDIGNSTVGASDLVPNDKELTDIYAFADQVEDDVFEEALSEAKAEENLSRANVRRKVEAKKGKPPKPSKRPEHLHRTRHIDPNRVVDSTVQGVVIPATTFELLDGRYDELDRDRIAGWVSSLSEAITALSRLRTHLKKELTQ